MSRIIANTVKQIGRQAGGHAGDRNGHISEKAGTEDYEYDTAASARLHRNKLSGFHFPFVPKSFWSDRDEYLSGCLWGGVPSFRKNHKDRGVG